MRAQRIVLGSFVSLFAVATLAYCCGGYGDARASIKLQRPVQSALVRDGRLYAVNDQGELLVLKSRDDALKSLGKFEGNLIDIAGDKACFAVKNLIYVADLTKGTILASQVVELANPKVCFVGTDHLAIPKGNSVQIFNITSAKMIQTIDLRENEKAPATSAVACRTYGNRLYVVTAGAKSGLVVIDLQKNQVVDTIPIDMGFGSQDFQIHQDKAMLLSHFHIGYGAWGYRASIVDLKTRQVTSLKLPAEMIVRDFGPDHSAMRTTLAIGQGNHFTFVSPTGVFQYDGQVKLVGPALPKTAGRILTVWNRSAVIAGKESLEIVPLSIRTVRGE